MVSRRASPLGVRARPPFLTTVQKAANGRRYDANATSRRLLDTAVKDAYRGWKGPDVPPGKATAELGFGFRRYLSSKRHHDGLWAPRLHTAFRPGTDRRAVDEPVRRLHDSETAWRTTSRCCRTISTPGSTIS